MNALKIGIDYHPNVTRRFNRDIEDHEMSILHDDGLYRHLRFTKPNTDIGWFSIITSPGQLTIFGDMGTYVFARLQDMFEFFQGNGYVNADYWGEKLQAVDTSGGYREFSEDLFKEFIIQNFWDRREQYEPAVTKQIWDDIRDSMFDDYADRSSARACHDLMDRFNSYGYRYVDYWEHNFEDYSYHYLWCCHAILWGIQQYNESKVAVTS